MIHPDFENWSHDGLIRFAKETYEKLIDDACEMDALRKDLKDAIKAYRHINTRTQHDKKES